LAIQVLDATTAIVPVIQLAPKPATVAVLALGAKHIAANVNITARLGIRSGGHNSSAAPRAFQPAIVIDDLTHAAVVAIERGGGPVAICGFADGSQVVAASVNIAAGL
jgi:hypothetical protein